MTAHIHQEIHQGLDSVSEGRLRFVRKAFGLLPSVDRPRILDVGCGRGGTTFELARLSGGDVMAIDIDAHALDELTARAIDENLCGKIRVMNCSMSNMVFEDGSIDIIWAEGSIHTIGFEEGLETFRRFLAPRGSLVIHEMAWLRPDPPIEIADYWRRIFSGIRTLPEYIAVIPRYGYHMIGHFALPEDFWWKEYYKPLQNRLDTLRDKYKGDPRALRMVENQQREVDLYKKHSHWYGSVYVLMQKQAVEGYAGTEHPTA
jgi:SAM-dependent methyltransferase